MSDSVMVRSVTSIARVVTPAPRDTWRSLQCRDPDTLPFQTVKWMDWLCSARGYVDASRLYEFDDGRRMVLPLAGTTVGGIRVAAESMPYGFGYGGPIGDGTPISAADVHAIVEDLRRQPLVRTGISPSPHSAGLWTVARSAALTSPLLSQVVDLDGGFDTVWSQRYGKKTRNLVRRGAKASLDVRRSSGLDLVTAFESLQRQSVDRWAAQRGQPRWIGRAVERRRDRTGLLVTARTALGDMVAGWTAYLNGEPVAAYVTLSYGTQAVLWMSAMNQDLANRTSAGYLLQSRVIEEACERGARWCHLGESDPGSGVQRFKASFGAASTRHHALRFERLPLTTAFRGVRRIAGYASRLPGASSGTSLAGAGTRGGGKDPR